MTSPQTIQNHFEAIAHRYDLTNAIGSLGLHTRWNQRLIDTACTHAPKGPLLDLCAGTGAIAAGYLKQCPEATAQLLDFSPQMLAVARAQITERAQFLQADAQQIPLATDSMNVCTCAYGIRNVADPVQCAQEVHRVLTPGGTWLILELTRPENALLRMLHTIHLKTTLPLIGAVLTRRLSAYRYLATSIGALQPPDQLAHRLTQAGFSLVKLTPLSGGIATLIELQANTAGNLTPGVS